MMDVSEAIAKRTSVRAYEDKPIYGAPVLILLSAPKDAPYGTANTTVDSEHHFDQDLNHFHLQRMRWRINNALTNLIPNRIVHIFIAVPYDNPAETTNSVVLCSFLS